MRRTTDTTQRLRRVVAAAVVLWLCVFWAVGVRASGHPSEQRCTAEVPLLPETIEVPPDLQSVTTRLLQRSPTFRRQCARLATARTLRVVVRINALLTTATLRARTAIRRVNHQPVLAVVTLGYGSRPEQWLPHELEHVIEQLDGWDPRTGGVSESWEIGRNLFESRRAVETGLTVLSEIQRFRQPALRPAGQAQAATVGQSSSLDRSTSE